MPGARGTVVVYSPSERGYVHSHERSTHFEIARRLAILKGFEFAGEYEEPSSRYAGQLYFVPTETLGISVANGLGIHSEQDLFGGVVPYPFVATKVITHPLVDVDAHAPIGWPRDFEQRMHDVTLVGFSAFTLEDARCAGKRVLEHGPVRIKPARATGGRGQFVASDIDELQRVLDAVEPTELSGWGLVLEENLTEVTTYSVGQVRVAELVASYCGTQRLTPDHSGAEVYGGSDLTVVRGDFEALLRLDLPIELRLAVRQACDYGDAALERFPELLASRRNYDIAQGRNAERQWRSGVLEQSWRIGGASCAEVAALEAFRADAALQVVRASCVEIFDRSDAPSDATVYFCGTDERVGPITKYTLVEPYDDAR
jgi:hypothetical protein